MNLLVVSDQPKVLEQLTSLLAPRSEHFYTATGTLEARNLLQEHPDLQVVLLYSPLEGRPGDEPVRRLLSLTGASVVLLTQAQIAQRMEEKLKGTGVFVVETPLKKDAFLTTLQHAVTASDRSRRLFEENATLRTTMAELKTIERAKLLLVECLKLSEDQAHKYIERQAMELRESRAEVARRIISTYQS